MDFKKCLAEPRNKLCMGSIICILGASKYGSLSSTLYRQPNSLSRYWRSVFVLIFSKLRASSTCFKPDLYIHFSLSKPEKFIVPTVPENLLKHREQPRCALCPRNPHTFLPAGRSQATQSKAQRISLLHFTVATLSSTPPHSFSKSSTSGSKKVVEIMTWLMWAWNKANKNCVFSNTSW